MQDVSCVFYGQNYISVSLKNEDQWPDYQNTISTKIEQFFQNEHSLFIDTFDPLSFQKTNDQSSEDSETVEFIKQIIETRLRPIGINAFLFEKKLYLKI
jgi:hypothetical protein